MRSASTKWGKVDRKLNLDEDMRALVSPI